MLRRVLAVVHLYGHSLLKLEQLSLDLGLRVGLGAAAASRTRGGVGVGTLEYRARVTRTGAVLRQVLPKRAQLALGWPRMG